MKTLEMLNTPIGSYAPDFELPGTDAQVHHLSRYLEKWSAIGVVSMANECPYVDAYIDRLKQLQAEFCQEKVTLIGLNSVDMGADANDTFKKIQDFAQTRELNFPYLWDATQDVMRSFGAVKTPTVFLIDGSGIVRYRGRIDDNHEDAKAVQKHYLHDAIAALVGGKPIEVPETEPIGTGIIWRN